MSAVPDSSATTVDLTPYVPRVVVDWMRAEPEARRRALPGTLAFVDISGFTAMNERLAQKGKLGAEEVTDVMNRTFERLLDVAYAFGGGLLKFGGDALLLFFSGEEHAARACDAAHGMRTALHELGPPQTSAGSVTLQMHVGIHSDTFEFFLVGDSHRELLLTGPGVTRTVEMESGAEAGEILVSEETAASLPADMFGDAKEGGRLLRAASGVPGGIEPLPPLEGLDLSACVPATVRRVVESATAEPEHRQASVAFVHFGGVDDLLAERGPDELAGALDHLISGAQRVADEHGVTFLETDIDTDGGKIILVAGAPQTEGEDEERILRTARGIADLETPLPLRIGTSRGRVFAGEVGAKFRRTYTILGKTAALAARLMGKAQPGQVLTTPELLERSRSAFQTTELEPLQLKGIPEPVIAHDVQGVSGEVAAPERGLPFVGRERELAILSAALGPVRMGFGNIVELIAEPGMGKSRLVEELQDQAPDLFAVTAACEQYESSTPYFAFRGLLRSLLELPQNGAAPVRLRARISELCPELVPWLPLVALPLDVQVEPTREVEELQPAFRRARLHGVVETLLGRLLSGPTLLVIEDVHWMDEASADLLRHLGGQISSKPWLLCATRRPGGGGFTAAEGIPPIPAMTIQLQPLDGEAAQELVGATTEGLLQHEVAAITERAGGNPLFLQELVASSGSPEEEALPESVEAVVATRVDKLPPGDRALLRYAAVLGATFSAQLVTEVLAHDPAASTDSEAWDRLAEFVERDPYTPGAFRFRHALFRDAAYEGLSYRRRRELHAQVGEAYERLEQQQAGEYAELLSLHFSHADDPAKTYRYSLAAGERAQAKFANVEAAGFFGRALNVAGDLDLPDEEVARVWESLGDVSELAGLYSDAAEAYAKAQELDGHPRLLLKEGIIRERFGRYSDALQWYDRGLRAADSLAPAERAEMRFELALAYAGVKLRQGEFRGCIDWCSRVVEEADPGRDLAALGHAFYLLHLSHTSLRTPERTAFRGLALPIYEELGDLLGQANVLNNLGIDAYYEGRWQEALDLYERSKAARERIGDVVGAAQITNNIGEVKSDQGYLTTASELFEEARSVFDAAGHRMLATLATSNLGRAASRAGRLEEALTTLRKALADFHEIRAGSNVLETKARLAEHAVFAGESDEALALADETLTAIEETESGATLRALLHRLRGYALAQEGDLEGASEALRYSIEIARAAEETYEAALTLEATARLAELEGTDGTTAAEEARTLFARLGVVSTPDVPL